VSSASCPGAAPGLSDFGDLSAQLVRNLSAVSNGAASRVLRTAIDSWRSSKDNRINLLPCAAPPASQHWQCRVVASGLWPRSPADGSKARRRVAAITAAKMEESAKPGSIPMPRRSLYKMCGPADSRQLIRLPPSAGPLFTIKNEHHYELLCSRTRRYFTADVSVFQAHLPCDSLSIFSYRIEPKPSVM